MTPEHDTPDQPSTTRVGAWARTVASHVPDAAMLSEREWRGRHRAVSIGLYASLVVALSVGIAMQEFGHALLDLAVPVACALAVPFLRNRTATMLVTSLGILACAGLLIHASGGLIESHFSFFVLLPLIALYHDWKPFAFSIVYVALGHATIGLLEPEGMYNHAAAIANPVKWGLIHAAYVLTLATIMIVHWNFAERPRHALRATLDELQATQVKLVEAQKLESIGALAAGVAHEINTPIQFVGDNLEFLERSLEEMNELFEAWSTARGTLAEDEGVRDVLAPIQTVSDAIDIDFLLEEIPTAVGQSREGIHRVAEIVKALKGFSHPSDEVSPHDLNALIADTSQVSKGEWKYVAELELDLADGLPHVPVAPGSFNQVVLNLMVNAAHAIEDTRSPGDPLGTITIATGVEGDHAVVRVSDTGCGIPDDVARRVFDQFFTTKDVGRGTGQGLSHAHSVITSMGGTIDFDSVVGEGTTFAIRLPLTNEHHAPPSSEPVLASA